MCERERERVGYFLFYTFPTNMGRVQIGLHSSVFNLFQSRPTHASVFCSPLHKSVLFSFVVTGKNSNKMSTVFL